MAMKSVSFFNINGFGNLGNQFFNLLSSIGIARMLNLPLYCTGLEQLKQYFYINYDFLNSVYITNPQCIQRFEERSEINVDDYECLLLYGYLIDPFYFPSISPKDIFSPKGKPTITSEKEVIFNVRLGDYVTHFSTDFTILPYTDYYKQARNLFVDHKIYIVTDSPRMARKLFNDEVLDLSIEECLGYLIGAKNIVCANSTFSWMGASLSNADNIIVPDIFSKKKLGLDSVRNFWRFQTKIINVSI